MTKRCKIGKVIEINELKLLDKDHIHVTDLNDFIFINKLVFDNQALIFKFNNFFYMIGSEVVFIHRES